MRDLSHDRPPIPVGPLAGPAVPFCDILKARTGAKYAYCENYFVHAQPQSSDVVPCGELTRPDVLNDLIRRFSPKYDGADPRAIASMWTMYYFSMLTIGSAVAMLEVKRDIPIGLADASLCIRRDTGEPHAFLIRDAGGALPDAEASGRLYSVLRDHAEPLVGAIAGAFGISRKLVWTNAASYFNWIVGEVSGAEESYRSLPDTLVAAKTWPDGGTNPFFDLIRPCVDENGESCRRRRVCCLRYSLPGCQGCGQSCPLPLGRNPHAQTAAAAH